MKAWLLWFGQLVWACHHLLAQNPTVTTVTASDPDDLDGYYSLQDIITISFDVPTNTRPVTTKAQIDALMTFSQSLGSNYVGTWVSNQVLVITILNIAGHGNPIVGTTTVTLLGGAGGIRDITNTYPAAMGPFILDGNWGNGSDKLYFGGIGSGAKQDTFQNPWSCFSFFSGNNGGHDTAYYINPKSCFSFFGGDNDGHDTTYYINPKSCFSFFGGDNDGYDTAIFVSPFTCPMLGDSGGPYSSGIVPGLCVMYWGTIADGYAANIRNSTFVCGSFMGDSSQGYDVEVFANPFTCVSFFGQPGQGYTSQAYQTPYQCIYFSGGADGFAVDSSGCVQVTLPILYAPLTVQLVEHTANLRWLTYMEQNCAGFDMQKSIDGQHWHPLTWVDGQGSSNQITEYFVQDTSVDWGVTYYRFIQRDFDGRFSISNEVAVDRKPLGQAFVSIFPNPVRVHGNIHFRAQFEQEDNLILNISSLSGANVFQQSFQGKTHEINISTEHFSAGMYIIQWQTKTLSGFQKLIVIE